MIKTRKKPVASRFSSFCSSLRRWLGAVLGASALGCYCPAYAQFSTGPTPSEPNAFAPKDRELPFQAQVQHLSDGDSFVVRTEDGRRIPIRLSAIDAPEKIQPFGDASRRSLRSLIDGKSLTIFPIKRDPYGRTVAKVLVSDQDIGLEQIRAGMAWHYRRYESEQSPVDRRDYAAAERRARAERVGLWADEGPVPPWRFREEQRRGQRVAFEAPAYSASLP